MGKTLTPFLALEFDFPTVSAHFEVYPRDRMRGADNEFRSISFPDGRCYRSDVYTSNKAGSIPCTCTTVKKLSRILGKTYDAALGGSGINITQLAVLRCISRRSGEPLSHIADELEMDRTSLYRAIAPMERDGWIAVADGKDARSRTAMVLHKGKSVLKKADKGWEDAQSQIVNRFGKAEWLALMTELHRLADCASE